jgi:hypothetical protein
VLDTIVGTFETEVMRLVQRWWNGRFGRLARRDIWLEHDEVWHVRARQGDGESRIKSWTYPTRQDADAMLHRLRETGGDGWTDITAASSPDLQVRPERRP